MRTPKNPELLAKELAAQPDKYEDEDNNVPRFSYWCDFIVSGKRCGEPAKRLVGGGLMNTKQLALVMPEPNETVHLCQDHYIKIFGAKRFTKGEIRTGFADPPPKKKR